jgi:Tol biopolymer transport system component
MPRRRIGFWLVGVVALLAALESALLVGGARSASEASGLIAFTRADGVYVMHTDGSKVRRVMRAGPTALYTGGIAWSPDGTKFVVGSWDGIWLMDANGRNQVRVATGGEPYYVGVKPHRTLYYPRATNFGSPSWSPDGRRIAFTAFQGVGRDIWIMNADGSNQHRLKETPFFEGEMDWSPTGGWLVFDSGSWVSEVYVIRTNGTGMRNLHTGTRPFVGSGQPSWSPDGRRIVFARPSGIWVTDVNGRLPVQLTNAKLDGFPDWSPDGRKIAFVRKLVSTKGTSPAVRDASSEIYVMNADGTGVTRLTHNHLGEASPAWQPVATP